MSSLQEAAGSQRDEDRGAASLHASPIPNSYGLEADRGRGDGAAQLHPSGDAQRSISARARSWNDSQSAEPEGQCSPSSKRSINLGRSQLL